LTLVRTKTTEYQIDGDMGRVVAVMISQLTRLVCARVLM
jgi:hypothetical protein